MNIFKALKKKSIHKKPVRPLDQLSEEYKSGKPNVIAPQFTSSAPGNNSFKEKKEDKDCKLYS